MELFDSVSKIRDRGIDVNNKTNAVTQAEDWESDQSGYENAVFEITGHYIHTQFPKQAKQFYINVVSEIVSQYNGEDDSTINVTRAIESAKTKTKKYFEVFRSQIPQGKFVIWQNGSAEFVNQLKQQHQQTYVRPKSKQDRAIEIVKANPTATNKQLQEMFREQLKLTANGAATYVYNARKLIAAGKVKGEHK
jgi:hypothetical protein